MAEERLEWRVERYLDESDPFAAIQWYVMQGNTVVAQCEIEAYAERILTEHEQHVVYARVLEQIAAMSSSTHDLAAAVAFARRALETRAFRPEG